jgi:hypothetical protein
MVVLNLHKGSYHFVSMAFVEDSISSYVAKLRRNQIDKGKPGILKFSTGFFTQYTQVLVIYLVASAINFFALAPIEHRGYQCT